MPPRSAPTIRQRRFGAELRKLREHAGLSIATAAELLGTDRPRITNMELGRFGVSEERLRTIAALYSCADIAYVEALVAMAQRRKPGWWEGYRDVLPAGLLDLSEIEHDGVAMRSVQTSHLPGLLQTADHARGVFAAVVMPPLPPSQVEARVSHRIRRQVVLERDDPPLYSAVVHEAALRMQFGGPQVAQKQLQYLLEASERDNVRVRVIPFAAGGFPGAGHSMLYVSGAVPQLYTVQIDTAHASMFLDAETHLGNYRNLMDHVERMALGFDASRDLIRRIAQEI
jgi:transcriptional regulator with XRE-family HTH domain